jgi:hypothetical protein
MKQQARHKFLDVIQATLKNSLEILVSLVTRFKDKRFKEIFIGLLQDIWIKVDFKKILNNEEQVLINLIHVREELVDRHSYITKILKLKDSNLSILIFSIV